MSFIFNFFRFSSNLYIAESSIHKKRRTFFYLKVHLCRFENLSIWDPFKNHTLKISSQISSYLPAKFALFLKIRPIFNISWACISQKVRGVIMSYLRYIIFLCKKENVCSFSDLHECTFNYFS